MTAPESRCPRAMTDYRRARPVYETYASLDADRETGPFLHADFTDHPFWMVTRYDHVLEALQLPEVFGNEVINPMDPNMSVELLPNKLNPPEHTKLRGSSTAGSRQRPCAASSR